MKKSLGTHLIVEFFDCDPHTLTDKDFVERVMMEAALKSHTHPIGSFFHQFKPYGVSGVIVIEESHYTIHTWPEHGYAAIDLFYCSEDVDVEKALEILEKYFKPGRISLVEMQRGLLRGVGVKAVEPLKLVATS